ncbi:poly(ADP-ribose) glycohydrolase-like isoform X2 [Neocloeon triangulifer]|uniref:poly(ADP-ribose) glycohydrolase-like isoform X2 n=1 Tax=Neocloeon triangulifer TaxID=2078957 RepID=UPI00286F258F|nr:poly(ADP-ribose) glycohydrolase-like isoform X2 [Neocloeon triangulifer]
MEVDSTPPLKKQKLMENDSSSSNVVDAVAPDEEDFVPCTPNEEIYDEPQMQVAGTSECHPLSQTSSSSSVEKQDSSMSTPEKNEPGSFTLDDLIPESPTTSLPPVVNDRNHFVFFELPWDNNCSPKPRTAPFDHPVQRFVELPCFTAEGKLNEKLDHWERIEKALSKQIKNWDDLRSAIHTCSKKQFKCDLLYQFLYGKWESSYVEDETETFFDVILPKIQILALKLPKLITQPIPLLRSGQSISLTQMQVASILANAFFCTFKPRDRYKCNMPVINFEGLYHLPSRDKNFVQCNMEKLKCFITYFRRIHLEKKIPTGVVTYHRQAVQNFPKWHKSDKPIKRLHVSKEGTIEDDGIFMLQVDFANKFLGGGVLTEGCVQEEIRFTICPELIAGCLFNTAMKSNEAIIICGAEQFNKYKGYGSSFEWAGSFIDKTPRDDSGRRCVSVVAIDAIPFYSKKSRQYLKENKDRELNKAYAGFLVHTNAEPIPVASGNWGCGVFGGDPRLKAILQLLAASECERDLVYFTFRDKSLVERLTEVHQLLIEKKATVGNVYKELLGYEHNAGKGDVLSFLKRKFSQSESVKTILPSVENSPEEKFTSEDADYQDEISPKTKPKEDSGSHLEATSRLGGKGVIPETDEETSDSENQSQLNLDVTKQAEGIINEQSEHDLIQSEDFDSSNSNVDKPTEPKQTQLSATSEEQGLDTESCEDGGGKTSTPSSSPKAATDSKRQSLISSFFKKA